MFDDDVMMLVVDVVEKKKDTQNTSIRYKMAA